MPSCYQGILRILLTGLLLVVYGCSNDHDDDGAVVAQQPVFPENATFIEAGDGLTGRIQEALINAQSGDFIVLPEGTFDIENTLTFDGDVDGDQNFARGITIAGYGRERTILDFENANSGDGIYVQNAVNITLQDFTVREAKNNGVKAKDSNGIVFRRVGAEWLGELNEDNGAYGIYPVECQNVLIEDSYVRGSADAGVYVGQSRYIVVRRTIAVENVAGIEIENSLYADVYDNEAYGNTGGILVFDLPINNHKYGYSVRVFDNYVHDNNTDNFAKVSGFEGGVHITPPGTGVIVLATSGVEIFNNRVENHDTMGVVVASYLIAEPDLETFVNSFALPGQPIADGWNPIPRAIAIHDNTIVNAGGNPRGTLITQVALDYQQKHGYFPDILYDGVGQYLVEDNILGAAVAINPEASIPQPPWAEDGSDNICAWNNGQVSVGRYMEQTFDLNNADALAQNPQADLLFCELASLPLHTVTIDGVQYGCGIDDDQTGCEGGSIVGNPGDVGNGSGGIVGDGDLALCGASGPEVNFAALKGANCPQLSDYNIFVDAGDPTGAINGNGLPYDLTTSLFTDYASKYRYVITPDGQAAAYDEREAFDFPVGSVLVKTFALPANNQLPGIDEAIIETRLLIRREAGWAALPYVWSGDKSDAVLSKAGASISTSMVVNGMNATFDYRVPAQTDCKQCHQFKAMGAGASRIEPIGPKARFLNKPFDYASGTANQLANWQARGILGGAAIDTGTIETVPVFENLDAAQLAGLDSVELESRAKGYLDINCAHCHREEGNASNTGLRFEYWRPYDDGDAGAAHGACKTPIAFRGEGGLQYDLVPGDAADSIMHMRMASVAPRVRMPEIGRSLSHAEAVQLIGAWIDRLPPAACSN